MFAIDVEVTIVAVFTIVTWFAIVDMVAMVVIVTMAVMVATVGMYGCVCCYGCYCCYRCEPKVNPQYKLGNMYPRSPKASRLHLARFAEENVGDSRLESGIVFLREGQILRSAKSNCGDEFFAYRTMRRFGRAMDVNLFASPVETFAKATSSGRMFASANNGVKSVHGSTLHSILYSPRMLV